EPYDEWAALLRPVTGWDVTADELRAAARRIVLAKRVFNLREGATAADDALPRRMLDTPLELGSGRTATLTAERLQSMVAGYYAARGLDTEGRPAATAVADLLLPMS
ncbi:MAG: aldehyde ferredoxin oxidoreductase C-terminal domain-containing protein, partial [Pseudonocardia sp.]